MKYEYLLVTLDNAGYYTFAVEPNNEDWKPINDLGAEGWELVSVGWFRGSEATAIFKKPAEKEVSA